MALLLSRLAFANCAVGVRGFAGQSYATVFRNLLFCASASLSLVPVFAIFVMFQRCLVPGISTTSIKG